MHRANQRAKRADRVETKHASAAQGAESAAEDLEKGPSGPPVVPAGLVTPHGDLVEVMIETDRVVRVGKHKAMDALDGVSTDFWTSVSLYLTMHRLISIWKGVPSVSYAGTSASPPVDPVRPVQNARTERSIAPRRRDQRADRQQWTKAGSKTVVQDLPRE